MMKEGQQDQRSWQRRVLALCWLAYAFSYLCRTNLSIALPQMTAELGWSSSRAGMIGSAFFLSYGLGHLLNGILGDRLPVKKFMTIGLLGASVCNLLVGFFPVYGVFFVVWILNGLFLSMLWGPIVRALAIWYAPEERNLPAMIVSVSSLGGYLLSWAGLGILIEYTAWQGAFFIPGIVTLLFTIWFLLRMNDSPQRLGLEDYSQRDVQNTLNTPEKQHSISLWQLMKQERLVFFCLAAMAQGIIKDSINLWVPTILSNLHEAPASLTSAASTLIPIFSFLGVFLSGKLMVRYRGREKVPGILLFAGSGVLCLIFVFVLGKSLLADVIFFGVVSALQYGLNTILLTYIPLRLCAYGHSSGVAGIFNFCAYLGAGLSGIISGFLADISNSWGSSILLWTVLSVLGAFSIAGGFTERHTHSHSFHQRENLFSASVHNRHAIPRSH